MDEPNRTLVPEEVKRRDYGQALQAVSFRRGTANPAHRSRLAWVKTIIGSATLLPRTKASGLLRVLAQLVSGQGTGLTSLGRRGHECFGVGDVVQHLAARFFGIPSLNGRIDSLVKGQRPVDGHAGGELRHTAQQVAVDHPKQQVTNTIAAGTKNTFMEREIGIQPLLVRSAILHCDNCLSESDQVLGGGALSGTGRKLWFDNHARLEQLVMGEVVQEDEKIERLFKGRFGAGAQVRPIAHPLGQNTHDLEHFQGLTQGGAVYAKLFRELTFRSKFSTWRNGPGRDKALDLFEDLGRNPRVSRRPAARRY